MNKESIEFFRKEVLRRRDDSLHGSVRVQHPSGWSPTVLAATLALAVILLLVWIVRNPEVESVRGIIRSESGVAGVRAPRGGTVVSLYAKNGSTVKRGQHIARVASQDEGFSGSTTDALSAAIRLEEDQLELEIASVQATLAASARAHAQESNALGAEAAAARSRAEMQRELVQLGQADLERVKRVHEQGYLSKRDLSLRVEKFVGQRQELTRMEGERQSKLALLSKTHSDFTSERAGINARLAQLRARRAAIARSRLTGDMDRGYTLSAPIEGTVENITALVGDSILAGESLYSVVSPGSRFIAQLRFTERLASSVRVGDPIRISLDAYPARKYGYVTGRITQVFRSPSDADKEAATQPLYVAYAAIDPSSGSIVPKGASLLHGMRLEAHLTTGRRSVADQFLSLFSG